MYLYNDCVLVHKLTNMYNGEASKPYEYRYDYGQWTTPRDVSAIRIRKRKASGKLFRKTCTIGLVPGRIIGV